MDLGSLNPEQRKAVQHDPAIPLQILAGPGSGKTKVLTSRIAFLVQIRGIPPSAICAVTFTNKAANEMKERLINLIGKERTAQVRMGTFHSQCALLLRKHASRVGLETSFTITDSEESKKIIKKLLVPHRGVLDAMESDVRDGSFLSLISNAKSRGVSPSDMLEQVQAKEKPSAMDHILASVYQKYELELRRTNSCDFDDLLVFAVELCVQYKKAVSWCQHVLVDEFQDTNVMQYQFMQHLSAQNNGVTIVGDPDQSIYGWRAAEVQNLKRMSVDFPGTRQVVLEQNYRSTGSILDASMAIVSQDKARIAKKLRTAHPEGTTPVLYMASSEADEAEFIAIEIKRVIAEFGGVLDWSHFAILLRFNALSRSIEKAFQQHGIPHRVLQGHKFFERQEVKDLLSFLLLVDNPAYVPGFQRALTLTTTGIGPKTLDDLLARATLLKMSPMATVERIYTKSIPDLRLKIASKVTTFVEAAQKLYKLAEEGVSPADLLRSLVDMIDYETHLRKTQPDWESRMENVKELISFAAEIQAGMEGTPPSPSVDGEEPSKHVPRSLSLIFAHEPERSTPLRQFLQASMLSSEGDSEKEEDTNKVTISTGHSAKGLEWPVVIIPAVEDGVFPFRRSLDTEEERRLLYVACTRAQGLLYLTHTSSRYFSGMSQRKELSPFLSILTTDAKMQKLLTNCVPEFNPEKRALIAKVLGKSAPKASEVSRLLAQFNATSRQHEIAPGLSSAIAAPYSTMAGPSLGFANAKGVQWKVAKPLPMSNDTVEISDDDDEEKYTDTLPLSSARSSSNNTGASGSRSAVAGPLTSIQSSTPTIQINPKWKPSAKPSAPVVASTVQKPTYVKPSRPHNSGAVPKGAAPFKPVALPTATTALPLTLPVVPPVIGVKRRLGMGRVAATGYQNKKFKPPM